MDLPVERGDLGCARGFAALIWLEMLVQSGREEGLGVGRLSGWVFAWAVLGNFPWEMGQAAAYSGSPSTLWHALRDCGMHSVVDGLLILGIFWGGGVVFRQADWIRRPGLSGYVWAGTTGFFLSVVIELNAVYRLGRWAYQPSMPLLPGLGVGLLPVLQMLVLPPLIFALASKAVGRAALARE